MSVSLLLEQGKVASALYTNSRGLPGNAVTSLVVGPSLDRSVVPRPLTEARLPIPAVLTQVFDTAVRRNAFAMLVGRVAECRPA